MKKYTPKTIMDYINGNDIEDFELEELEDDESFMKAVINYTNDKKMFFMCSERLQNDFEFITFILYKFRQDKKWISSIADTFLEKKKRDKEKEKYEIAVIMCDLLGNRKDDSSMKYHMIASVAFLWEIEFVQECKKKLPTESSKIGTGFIFVMVNDNSKEMIHFFAKRFINYILELYEIDFEELLHKHFKTSQELQEQKLNTFLINFLSHYDIALANYAKCHLDILDSLKERVKYAIQNWNNYQNKKERERFLLLFEEVHNYIAENFDCFFSEEQFLYSIGRELGILEQLQKYDYVNVEPENCQINKKEMDFTDQRHYHNIKEIMKSILDNTYPEYEEETTKEDVGKVIELFQSQEKKG